MVGFVKDFAHRVREGHLFVRVERGREQQHVRDARLPANIDQLGRPLMVRGLSADAFLEDAIKVGSPVASRTFQVAVCITLEGF